MIAVVLQLGAKLEDDVVPYSTILQKWIAARRPQPPGMFADDYKSIRDAVFADPQIDLGFLCDFRLEYVEEMDNDMQFYYRRLTFREFQIVFPEYSSELTQSIDLPNAIPEIVISRLLAERRVAQAHAAAKCLRAEEVFAENFLAILIDCLRAGDDLVCYFDRCEFVAPLMYARLPEELKNLQNHLLFLKIESHTSELEFGKMAEFERYCELLRIYPALDCDGELLALAEKEIEAADSRLPALRQIATRFAPLFKNSNSIAAFVCLRLFRLIDGLTVNSHASEDQSILTLRSAQSVIEAIKLRVADFFGYELQRLQIGFLLSFASSRPFSKLRTPYRFRNWQDQSFIESIVSLCCRADLVELLEEAVMLWPVQITAVRLHKLTNVLRLGLMHEGAALIERLEIRNESDIRTVHSMIDLLGLTIPIDVAFIPSAIRSDSPYVTETLAFRRDRKLRFTSLRRRVLERSPVLPQQLALQADLIGHVSREGPQIIFYSGRGRFADAFRVWKRLRNPKQTFAHGLEYIMLPALSLGYWEALWTFLHANRDCQDVFRHIIDGLCDFCHRQLLKNMLESVQHTLELFEGSIHSAIRFLKGDQSWDEKARDLQKLLRAIADETVRRAQRSDLQKTLADANLGRLAVIASVQFRFVCLALEANLPFNPLFDLVVYTHSVEEMAAIALCHRRGQLGIEIAALKEGSMGAVANKVLDKIAGQPLSDFFKQIQMRMDQAKRTVLCAELMKAVCKRATRSRDIPPFILAVIDGIPLQIHVLTECGFLQEALQVAQKTNSRTGIAQIMRTAQVLGNRTIEQRCRRTLNM
jgi:hypothetical protein